MKVSRKCHVISYPGLKYRGQGVKSLGRTSRQKLHRGRTPSLPSPPPEWRRGGPVVNTVPVGLPIWRSMVREISLKNWSHNCNKRSIERSLRAAGSTTFSFASTREQWSNLSCEQRASWQIRKYRWRAASTS